jgi:hypothetical protein
MKIRHFVLTTDGSIREFSSEQAAGIAAGANRLPEFADQRLRYLQITLEDTSETELKIQTSGACIRFDTDGRMAEAEPPKADENFSRFEHDACVQWALKDIPATSVTFH